MRTRTKLIEKWARFLQPLILEVLQIKEVEKPQIEPEQMLVKVHASSVNPIDWKIRKGLLRNRSGNDFSR